MKEIPNKLKLIEKVRGYVTKEEIEEFIPIDCRDCIYEVNDCKCDYSYNKSPKIKYSYTDGSMDIISLCGELK